MLAAGARQDPAFAHSEVKNQVQERERQKKANKTGMQ